MNIVIIGNGIAGITAARYIRKLSNHTITVISSESEHFFSRCALMYVYMGQLRYKDIKPYEDWFWKKNKINLIKDLVIQINPDAKKIMLESGGEMAFDKLLIATGSKWNKLDVKGAGLKGVHGFYSLQDLEKIVEHTRHIKKGIIVGGGLIGIELCEMLRSQNIEVTFLVREQFYYENIIPEAEAQLINNSIQKHGVDVRYNTQVNEIIGDETGNVKGVITASGEVIEGEFVGLAIGVHPNIDVVKNSPVAINNGILINEFMETNVPDIYAAGDCAQHIAPPPGRRPVEQFWYTGRIQGKAAAYNMCRKKSPYIPGTFFNSAKFFDLEYQIYGTVPANDSEDFDSIYWEHIKKGKAIRIVFDKNTFTVKGFSLLGIRFRHQICDQWIQEQRHMDYVMENLKAADFNPEFSSNYEQEIISIYNKRFNKNIQPKKKRQLWPMIFKSGKV